MQAVVSMLLICEFLLQHTLSALCQVTTSFACFWQCNHLTTSQILLQHSLFGTTDINCAIVVIFRQSDSLRCCTHLIRIQCSIQNLGSTTVQGKYLAKDGGPKEARLNKYKGRYAEAESRYGLRPNVVAAVQAYVDLAKHSGISPTALALR
jgi:hypothetical protein